MGAASPIFFRVRGISCAGIRTSVPAPCESLPPDGITNSAHIVEKNRSKEQCLRGSDSRIWKKFVFQISNIEIQKKLRIYITSVSPERRSTSNKRPKSKISARS